MFCRHPPIARTVVAHLCEASIATLLCMAEALPRALVLQLRFRSLRLAAGDWADLPVACVPIVEQLTVRLGRDDDDTPMVRWLDAVGPGAMRACTRLHLHPQHRMPPALLGLLWGHRDWLTHLSLEGALLRPAQTEQLTAVLGSAPRLVFLRLCAVHYSGHTPRAPYTACPNLRSLELVRDFWRERALGCAGTSCGWGGDGRLCLELRGGLPEVVAAASSPHVLDRLHVTLHDTHVYLFRPCRPPHARRAHSTEAHRGHRWRRVCLRRGASRCAFGTAPSRTPWAGGPRGSTPWRGSED